MKAEVRRRAGSKDFVAAVTSCTFGSGCMSAKTEELSVSSRLERLLHFVTGPSARDVPKVGIGSVAALQRVTKRHQAVTGQKPTVMTRISKPTFTM